MIKAGLCSVSFRHLSVSEVVQQAASAGLAAIEWGGDVHVPVGQLDRAREARSITLDAGISVSSYGSYHYLGAADGSADTVSRVLETSLALGAPSIRVWAGKVGSADAQRAAWSRVVEEARRAAEAAAALGMSLSLESHASSLTDTPQSTAQLLQEIHHPAVRCYWQPTPGDSLDTQLAWLNLLKPWLTNLHVFYWTPPHDRRPLAEGAWLWPACLEVAAAGNADRYALLEFVRDDQPEQLVYDAATLRNWLAAAARTAAARAAC